jgi:type I restriction enzyme S subunit
MSSEIPSSWQRCALADLAVDVIGGDWGADPEDVITPSEICYVMRGTDFRHWEIKRASNAPQRRIKKTSVERRSLSDGDIVVEISGGGPSQPVGRARVIDSKALSSVPGKLLCSNFFRRIRLHADLSPKYFALQLDYLSRIGGLNEYQTQTTNLRNLNFTDCSEAKIFSLPPPNEQKRIVAKLDELLPKVEACKQRLEKIPTILKRFRQSVLADAVSGKLTEEWRKRKTSNLDPIGFATFGEDNEFVAPTAWSIKRIGDCFSLIDGDRGPNYPKQHEYSDKGHCLFLSTKNVREYGFRFDDCIFISEEKHKKLRSGTLVRGDVVITTRGTLGNVAYYDDQVPFDVIRVNSGMLIMRTITKEINPDFLRWYIASSIFNNQLKKKQSGSAQPQIPAKIMRDFFIPIPSLDEQVEIVNQIGAVFKLLSHLDERYNSACSQVERTVDALLFQAFSGALVSQDPTDEPASALLERIKVSSASKPKKSAPKKRKAEKEEQSLSA